MLYESPRFRMTGSALTCARFSQGSTFVGHTTEEQREGQASSVWRVVGLRPNSTALVASTVRVLGHHFEKRLPHVGADRFSALNGILLDQIPCAFLAQRHRRIALNQPNRPN